MKFYRYMLFVASMVVLSLLSACNMAALREEMVYAESPVPADTLKAEVKQVSSSILYPLNIFVSGDLLVVCQPDMEQMFAVYRLPDVDYLYSFGRKGQGPSEFSTIYFKSIVPTECGFKVCCNDRRIYHVSLTDGSILEKERIESDHELFNGFCAINDSLYCFTDMRGEDTPFLMYNSSRKTTVAVGEYPRWISGSSYEKAPIKKVIDGNGYIVAKDDGTTWAFFYGYFDCFKIYAGDGELRKTICTGQDPNEEKMTGKRRAYYPYVPQTTNEYIYCIRGREKPSDADRLQVWQWDGMPVASYWLDRRISSFTLSERTGKIYAVSTDEEAADQIFVYDLPYY